MKKTIEMKLCLHCRDQMIRDGRSVSLKRGALVERIDACDLCGRKKPYGSVYDVSRGVEK